ncbi:hypothetical protein AB8810_12960 [Xanthomonas sp. NCPPB 3005]|uniref:hypothetical protein n=1 Tax=Xanthomonas sp. NCPPB 3005 TaxID=3240913 RepID=UPI003513F49C
MSEAKWTKQDWLVDGVTVYALNVEGTNRFSARVEGGWSTHGRTRTDMEEREATAHLIASAPDLYEALVDLIGWVPGPVHFHNDEPQKAVERARAALAKARGEA